MEDNLGKDTGLKICFYSSSHWDREWYKTFQGFRYMLVEMVDSLIDGLENCDGYGVFHFDGQTVVLEDYCQVVPENREKLSALIRNNKIKVGPWYCMPDEFLVSGESLIKNLRRGHRVAEEFDGYALKNGYICDMFGHIAQLPQIFREMGIDNAILGRGTNEHTTPAFFLWEAPDGSKVKAFKLSDLWGYSNISALRVFPDKNKSFKENLKDVIEHEKGRSDIPIIVLMDGMDHNVFREDTLVFIETIKQLYPKVQVFHTDITEMTNELDKYINGMPVKKGELIETSKNNNHYLYLITNTLSSRYDLKKENDLLQTRLEKWIQPLMAFNHVDCHFGFYDLAEKYLLLNHPHDSICGCSIDQVHKDMVYRFDQANAICDEIITRFKANLTAGKSKCDLSSDKNTGINNENDAAINANGDTGSNTGSKVLRIFNPLPYNDMRTVRTTIEFPKNYPNNHREPGAPEAVNMFKLFDADGKEVPYGITNIGCCGRYDQYDIVFKAAPTSGSITELSVVPWDKPVRYLKNLPRISTSAENEFIKLDINNNGTIDIYDKRTGKRYEKLLTLIDDAEMGDGYNHYSPVGSTVVTNGVSSTEIVENNAVNTCFKITQQLNVPKEVIHTNSGIRRSEDYIGIPVVHYVSLSKGDAFVRIKTIVDNKAKDHRLLLRLPTGISGNEYYANQSFCFVKRKTGINEETLDWNELGIAEKNMAGIVYKADSSGGLAFISEYGLHECAVYETGEIDITLFRSFSKTIHTDGEIDGQLQKPLEFSYIIMPVHEVTFAQLQKTKDILETGMLSVTMDKQRAEKYMPMFSLDGENICYSTSESAEGGLDIRLYNLSDSCSTGRIFVAGIKAAYLVDLQGNIKEELNVTADGCINLNLQPWKIATLRCKIYNEAKDTPHLL